MAMTAVEGHVCVQQRQRLDDTREDRKRALAQQRLEDSTEWLGETGGWPELRGDRGKRQRRMHDGGGGMLWGRRGGIEVGDRGRKAGNTT